MMTILKKLLILPPIAIAIFILVASRTDLQPPRAADRKEKPTPVKIIGAKPVTVIPSIGGYGTVQPGRSWDAVAQVAGSVVWTADTLRNGLLIAEGSELVRIDAREYELGLAQIDAQIAALDARNETTQASLQIEERALDLLRQDLERKQKLFAQGSTAKTALDNAERAMLTAQARVVSLQSSLKLTASERNVLLRQRDIAALNIDRTSIRAPFDIRLGPVDIARGQYVNRGQKLFSGDGIKVAEVVARFPVGALYPLLDMPGQPDKSPKETGEGTGGIGNHHKMLKARIHLRTPRDTIVWDASVDRITEAMDPGTRTRGIVLSVTDPYGKASPGQRPPLVRDTAVEVTLAGKPVKGRFVVPASAIHKGRVMLVDQDKRLRFASVEVAHLQNDIAILSSGLKQGDKVIVSGIPAPVEGMLLAPRPDKDLQENLIREAGQAGKPGEAEKQEGPDTAATTPASTGEKSGQKTGSETLKSEGVSE